MIIVIYETKKKRNKTSHTFHKLHDHKDIGTEISNHNNKNQTLMPTTQQEQEEQIKPQQKIKF